LLRTPGFSWTWGGEIAAVAKAIADGQGFASPYGGASGPTALVAPIYPNLLALFARLAPSLDAAARAAVFFNVLWSLLVCVPLYLIGRQCSRRVGVLLVSGWALAPLTGYTEAAYFWQTAFYTFVLTCLVAATLRLSSATSLRHWLAYAVFGGFSLLCEPAHSIAWPLALAGVIWQRRLPWTRFALVGVVSFLTILPWVVRNSVLFQRPTYIRGNLGWEIEEGLRTDSFDMSATHEMSPARDAATRAEYVTKGEARYLTDRGDLAWSLVKQHPAAIVRLAIARAWVFWTGNGMVAYLYWPPNRHVPLKYLLFALPGVAAIVALVILFRTRDFRVTSIVGAAFVFVFPLPYYLTLTEPRYRAPIEPALVALGLLGAVQLLTRLARPREGLAARNLPVGLRASSPR
jgi:hypothetical protein